MTEILNPYDAGRNIHGRWGRVFRDGQWIANATEVSYTVEIDRMEVARAGTRWNGFKEGTLSGSGSLTIDYVTSKYLVEFINYVNGRNSDGSQLADRRLKSWTIAVQLEDDQIPGIQKDANWEPVSGSSYEAVSLLGCKFWNLEGGYGADMISRSLEFTFTGIQATSVINDPLDLNYGL